jgi:hypothetical protein
MLSLAGCGLENIPVLSQPQVSLATGEIFQFLKLSANGDPIEEPEFLGFDVYYKIYDSEIGIENNISTIDELRQRFRRLTEYDSVVQPSPLIPISSADLTNSFYIDIDFSLQLTDLDRPRIYSLPGIPPVDAISIQDFRRGVLYSGSSETKRWADFTSADADIAYDADIWTILNTVGSKVTIAVYVVSYGVSIDYGELYSIPLYLGYIQVDLPPY